MDVLSSVILGLVQGLTEFIPVSSSGHLILVREFFGMEVNGDALAFDAVLQLATAFAILWYFRADIRALIGAFFDKVSGKPGIPEHRTLFLALAFGTIPAVLAGLFLEETMETLFRSSTLVALMLLAGAALMFVADRLGKQTNDLTVVRGLGIGVYQALALIPGISRSGAAISGGLLLGLTREVSARFAFLLGFPILFGSGLKKLLELWRGGYLAVDGFPLLVGSIIAFLSGIAAIHFLVSYLKRRDMTVFIVYRIILASVIFFFL